MQKFLIVAKYTRLYLGLVLLFILPRHTFACVQSALFPKYMILNGVTALAVLISFVQTKKVWSSQENYQVNICFDICHLLPLLFSHVYFWPSNIHLLHGIFPTSQIKITLLFFRLWV
jgi:hypothetical protein